MSSVANTPPEILHQILFCLANKDLFSTSLVSHRWHALSQPLLYNDPYLITSGDQESIYCFVRTIITPGGESLASHVRSLNLYYPSSEPEYPEVDVDIFTAAAARLGLGEPLASEAALIVLLMHLLPCLHVLSVIPNMRLDELDALMQTHHTAQPVGTLPLAFRSLREFNWFSDNYSGISSAMLFAILKLPCIRVIRVDMIDELEGPFLEFGTASTTALTGTSAITHITFQFITISSSYLGRILLVPRALKYLSYHMPCQSDFSLSDLRQALQPLQHSLCHLHLQFFLLHDDVPIAYIGSLRDWPELRCVRCSLVTLLGVNTSNESTQLAHMLPRRLHALEIFEDCHWTAAGVVDMVVNMLDQKVACLPGLRRLAVRYNWHLHSNQLERLMIACKAADVEFVGHDTRLVEDGCW